MIYDVYLSYIQGHFKTFNTNISFYSYAYARDFQFFLKSAFKVPKIGVWWQTDRGFE